MIKVVYCITKGGPNRRRFFHYWEHIDGALDARIPHLRRLVQSDRLIVQGHKHRPDYDGMVELWFDDREALMAARQSSEWQTSSEDEANFIDHNKVAYFVSEEHLILGEAK